MMQDAELIFYDQPLNDYTRICLRVEHLWMILQAELQRNNEANHRVAMLAIVEILHVIDRSDLKTKLTKALTSHAENLARLQQSPRVDADKLAQYLAQIAQYRQYLYAEQLKLGQHLRDNSFLKSIAAQRLTPGGPGGFNTPAFELWLKTAAAKRQQDLQQWHQALATLAAMVSLLLKLIREQASPRLEQVEAGFLQINLDPSRPCHMLRLALPVSRQVFPEMSVGKHRLSLRFLELDLQQRPKQSTQSFQFELCCCSL